MAVAGGDLDAYLCRLRAVLQPALCLHSFPSQTVERHIKPLIELEPAGSQLVLPPVTVTRSEKESALVEQSVNSTRVSLRFKAADSIEEYCLRTFLRFMVHRADELDIVRRVPLPGWHITFLVTDTHLQRYRRQALVEFICTFVEGLYSEISAMKLGLRSRARAVVQRYWQELEQRRHQTAAAAPSGLG